MRALDMDEWQTMILEQFDFIGRDKLLTAWEENPHQMLLDYIDYREKTLCCPHCELGYKECICDED